jgi:hypothetical protein
MLLLFKQTNSYFNTNIIAIKSQFSKEIEGIINIRRMKLKEKFGCHTPKNSAYFQCTNQAPTE